ncbi:hypothetical protein ABOM_003411 [Aspergillus bombycis]|uniref:Transcription factor domain-containing protein n=1 Tax=Aspergillus bombycis TaxID=109264 RepID=A0A1F8AAP5_9EURO|nr:hypothetical protein ABOM_003411 [Aspergillus bombycis]OGM48459.1 hypothetical protein ABOM_003411 [Aspergillus bombycis]
MIAAVSVTGANAAGEIIANVTDLGHALHPLSTDRPGHYTNAFFFALGLSPTLLTAFSINAMASMIQENKILQDTVSLVGGFYASRSSNLLTFSKNEKRDLVIQWHQLQKSVALGIQEVSSDGKSDVLLACALLLSFVQILDDISGRSWCAWVYQLHVFVWRDGKFVAPSTPLLRSMRRLARIMNALRALCLEQDLDLALPFRSHDLGSRVDHLPPHGQDASALSDDQLLDYFCEDLEMWAKLQWLTADWKTKSKELGLQLDPTNRIFPGRRLSELEYGGVELTCTASQFQRDIIASLLWYNSEKGRSLTNTMLAFYHCVNVDISLMFCDSVWLSLNCELPVMTHQMSYEQATNALQHAENGLQSSYLEAIFYAPTLYTVSMTRRYKSERSRIVDFISQLKQKGFFVADQFLSVIEEAWAAR